ncbi:uncharacterized protein LOC115377014 [Myripristis murdjan]|uniref:uncharacterized protein LOC115377014 n=1 Tax=Myripristis murdjan TaxID=586833 RepID=UPI001176083F|nr:uncharacterized protein LOC115377014 [Myripristis murdjan]
MWDGLLLYKAELYLLLHPGDMREAERREEQAARGHRHTRLLTDVIFLTVKLDIECFLTGQNSAGLENLLHLDSWEEMISILLLVVLTASVCGALVLNVRQSVCQAEENRNVTMEWTFTPNMRLTDMEIYLALWVSELKTSKTVYYQLYGVEYPEVQDEQFAGRVGLDKDELRKGNIRLHLSRLRTEDSGVYRCEVATYFDGNISECSLNVTAARIQPTAEETQPASRGRIALFFGLGLCVAALFLLMFFTLHGHISSQINLHCVKTGGLKLSSDQCEQSIKPTDQSLWFSGLKQSHCS